MSHDPFGPDDREVLVGKTLWLKPSTLKKLNELKLAAPDKNKIIASVKAAVEEEVERLWELARRR